MHGLRHAPGCSQVKVSFSIVIEFGAGIEFPRINGTKVVIFGRRGRTGMNFLGRDVGGWIGGGGGGNEIPAELTEREGREEGGGNEIPAEGTEREEMRMNGKGE